MKFKIPFTFSDMEVLKRKSKSFIKFTKFKKGNLNNYLENSGKNINQRQYISICYRNFLFNLLISSILFTTLLLIISKIERFYFIGFGSAFLISGFILFNQINYPKVFSLNKTKNIERNLIPVLQDMMVQLSSGVPIFSIMINISNSNYGEVSNEFKKITKEINSGVPQIEAIEKYGKLNTSEYFKRVLWQISNGMRAGSDMGIVIKEGITDLSEEQSIQIQSYGSKLNPIIMFYMLIAVIIPSLGITFLIIISSILNLPEKMVQLAFSLIFAIVIFMQIMFLGIIKSKRPSLL